MRNSGKALLGLMMQQGGAGRVMGRLSWSLRWGEGGSVGGSGGMA